ncbi:response regulator [Tenacibaculum finnmarkense]|uniref:Transcriptional regulator n=1 Tax=Tenacibaculum finnmarkense genomovar ulcerans TaxID=2781388 RepID=A0A2I2MCA5_9FLAO|nr:response regulator [Tenacibaculum finnmarkense]ALU75062.1 transcriptional regulator [Tenacibaculum dicentrarchi]MBE7633805.1 response regulator [Tenacibaculum finnmarkense genomovar ulcerans]MBE7645827.1 response regulator [Tenacibaculum finnmarkense genomovar ulcerans]MBE7647886.1 response regulator [Tenacibaculum finnmarkense genomovar ulcerans]MBE7688172.1 response regulator [Tenacibaculum finnmarkense genomovar ulcerans]
MEKIMNVLLIEDTIIEIMKMKRTVSFLKLQHTITEAKDAEIALKILEEKSNLPDLILLDLNMPKISGIEFLSIIKNDDTLKHIPTVILTTSDNQKDLEECYKIGVSGYILKPLKYEDYVAKIEVVLSYWSINELKKY